VVDRAGMVCDVAQSRRMRTSREVVVMVDGLLKGLGEWV
jgi:hypothetical protein